VALDHARVVLSGILPDRRDLLVEAMRWLEPEHFSSEVSRNLWQVLTKFYDLSGGVLTRRYIDEIAKVDASRAVLLAELYDTCAATRVSDSEVRASVQVMREIRTEHLTAEALTRGMEILTRGGEVDGKEVEPGQTSAWAYIQSEYSRIAHLGSIETAPEGDVFAEPEAGLADYAKRKELSKAEHGAGIRTGIASIDRATGGAQTGEFVLVAGYTSVGKSMLCAQTAWYAATHQRRNVFYVTSETTRDTARRRIYARHSRLERFAAGSGLDSKDLKQGSLTEEGERTLRAITEDLAEGARTGQYGRLYVAQSPPGATWAYVASAARRVSVRWNIDLIVVDYLALLRPERRRDSQVQEFSDLLKEVKVFATSFADGAGVVVMSPWAIQQNEFKRANEKREYGLGSLSDTSEAEKSPDIVLSMLALDDEPGKVKMQVLKNRDGERPPEFSIEVDYRSSYLGDIRESANVESLIDYGRGFS
jgi:replicative DNA helicase